MFACLLIKDTRIRFLDILGPEKDGARRHFQLFPKSYSHADADVNFFGLSYTGVYILCLK